MPRERREFQPRVRESGGAPQAGTAFVYVAVGRKSGVRPNDLVGSIANEANLTGREIGPIRITDMYSVVGVPEARVDDVIQAMQHAVIRGRNAQVRRYVDKGASSGERSDRGDRGDRPQRDDRPARDDRGERKPYGEKKAYGEKKSYGDKKPYEKKPYEKKSYGTGAAREAAPWDKKPKKKY